jgi:hypothetical protein
MAVGLIAGAALLIIPAASGTKPASATAPSCTNTSWMVVDGFTGGTARPPGSGRGIEVDSSGVAILSGVSATGAAGKPTAGPLTISKPSDGTDKASPP